MKQQKIKWGNEDVTMLEMFKELDKLVCDPVRNMQEMDTEMYVSDYQKLSQAFWRISNTLQELKDD